MPSPLLLLLFLLVLYLFCPLTFSKTTIEPCSSSDSCTALLGYTLYADLKVSELAALFQADPYTLLAANSLDFSIADVLSRILPSGLFLRVPTPCACSDGIRKSVSVRYRTRPADTLAFIADSVFGGLASADQIRQTNALGSSPGDALDVGQLLVVPLPCTCFNSTDSGVPAIYLSYVAQKGDSVRSIATEYSTTVTDIMTVNSMGNPNITAGDILAIPLPACSSTFPSSALDYRLLVANGTYTLTAGHCVQCSCGPVDLNLYCTPALLAVSCSSMQCPNSNLMLGNMTAQFTSAGCNVASCGYGGSVNGSIVTILISSMQPQCPGKHQFPALVQPPTAMLSESPSPSPMPQPGGIMSPNTLVPGTASPGPAGSVSAATPSSKPLESTRDCIVRCLLCLLFTRLLLR